MHDEKRTHWTGKRSADTAFLNVPTDALNCQNINVKGGGQARPERTVPPYMDKSLQYGL